MIIELILIKKKKFSYYYLKNDTNILKDNDIKVNVLINKNYHDNYKIIGKKNLKLNNKNFLILFLFNYDYNFLKLLLFKNNKLIISLFFIIPKFLKHNNDEILKKYYENIIIIKTNNKYKLCFNYDIQLKNILKLRLNLFFKLNNFFNKIIKLYILNKFKIYENSKKYWIEILKLKNNNIILIKIIQSNKIIFKKEMRLNKIKNFLNYIIEIKNNKFWINKEIINKKIKLNKLKYMKNLKKIENIFNKNTNLNNFLTLKIILNRIIKKYIFNKIFKNNLIFNKKKKKKIISNSNLKYLHKTNKYDIFKINN